MDSAAKRMANSLATTGNRELTKEGHQHFQKSANYQIQDNQQYR